MIDSESTSGYNSTYYSALHSNYVLGRNQGIDAALKTYHLDALVLPSNGKQMGTMVWLDIQVIYFQAGLGTLRQ